MRSVMYFAPVYTHTMDVASERALFVVVFLNVPVSGVCKASALHDPQVKVRSKCVFTFFV